VVGIYCQPAVGKFMFNHVTLVYISTPFVKETNNLYHEVVSNKKHHITCAIEMCYNPYRTHVLSVL